MAEDRREDTSGMVDATFDALSRSRRRRVLYYLRDRKSATVEELATVVAGWTQAEDPETEFVTPDDRKQVLASLHHVDLPKLEADGFLRYDLDSKTVAMEPLPESVADILSKSLAYERATKRGDRSGRDDQEGEDDRGDSDRRRSSDT